MLRNIQVYVLDPINRKVCDLYDSSCQFPGQISDLRVSYNQDELTQLTFSLPAKVIDPETGETVDNPRWEYIKNEYRVLYVVDGVSEIFIIKSPSDTDVGNNQSYEVMCLSKAEQLKRRNITYTYETEIGNAEYHLDKILAGTGWEKGIVDVFYEEDLFDARIIINQELVSAPSNMSYGAYGELCGATGASQWDSQTGWKEANIKLVSISKNICDGLIERGKILADTGNPDYETDTECYYRTIDYIYAKPLFGNTLVVSGSEIQYVIWHIYDISKHQIAVVGPSKTCNVNLANCYYIKCEFLADSTGNTAFLAAPSNVQIEVGSVATEYEKYCAPYTINVRLGAFDSVSRNKIIRRTVYDDIHHTYSLDSSGGTQEQLLPYMVKLYEDGHIYAENDGAGLVQVILNYTVSEGGTQREKLRGFSKDSGVSTYDALNALKETFGAKIRFHSDTGKVDFVKTIGRDTHFAFKPNYNAKSIKRTKTSTDIITRLFVTEQNSDTGYIGIEDVNPLGTDYITDFSYYRGLGVLSRAQENAITQFEHNTRVNRDIQKSFADLYNLRSNSLNSLVGQTPMGLAKVLSVSGTRVVIDTETLYKDGTIPEIGDTIYVRHTTGYWDKYEVSTYLTGTRTIVLTESPGTATNVWWVSRPVSGIVGAKLIILETKKKGLADAREELETLISEGASNDITAQIQDKITEYENAIMSMNVGGENEVGLNVYIARIMSEIKLFNEADTLLKNISVQCQTSFNEFQAIMGEFLHDGIFPDGDYASGQELALYEDAKEYLSEHCMPQVEFAVTAIDRSDYDGEKVFDGCDFTLEDIRFGDVVYIDDPKLGISNLRAEITAYTDEPLKKSSNSFDISNFDKPVDLFNEIVKAAELAKANKRTSKKFDMFISTDGTINPEVLCDSLIKTDIGSQLDLTNNPTVVNAPITDIINTGNLGDSVGVISKNTFKEAYILGAQIVNLNAEKITAGTLTADRLQLRGADGLYYQINVDTNNGQISDDLIDSDGYRKYISGTSILANSIKAEKIAAGAITADKIDAGAITAGKIEAGAITTNTLAANAVTADKIKAGTIVADNIAAGTITADKLTSGLITVDSGLIADASIIDAMIVGLTADKITAGTIDAANINVVNLSADNLTVGTINGQRIPVLGTDKIADGAISGVKIGESAVTTDKIVARAITTDKLAVAGVQAINIDVNNLFADSAFVEKLNTTDISNNASLRIAVGDTVASNVYVEATASRAAFSADVTRITLSARAYMDDIEITGDLEDTDFTWSRVSADAAGDLTWTAAGKSVTLDNSAVDRYATFTCRVRSDADTRANMFLDGDGAILTDGDGAVLTIVG